MIREDDKVVYGDSGYLGIQKRAESMEEEHLSTITPRFWVTESKTGKRRQVGLPRELLDAVKAQAGPEWAFPGRKAGRPLTRQAVWADVKRAAKAFRLPQNVAPHSFRKVYAVDLLRRYGDVKRVQRALNHSSHTTTMIYAMADKLLAAKAPAVV